MASDAIKELTDADFDATIAQGVTLVDFWAPWCGPCRMQTPILDEVVTAVGDTATIGKVNVDEHTAAAAKFGVRSIPTLLVFKDGEEVERFVGVQQAGTLVQAIESQA